VPRLCFPKSARLTRAGEFAKLKRHGESFHGKLMVLSILKTESDADTRVGLITSRRVGGAVVRNRVRRQLRELVRHSRPLFARGFWVALIARSAAAEAPFAALQAEWLKLARRSALLTAACS
jgi:ribonuclease P protein component